MKIWFNSTNLKDSALSEYDSNLGCNINKPLNISKVNLFVGANNCGKSRFIRLVQRELNNENLLWDLSEQEQRFIDLIVCYSESYAESIKKNAGFDPLGSYHSLNNINIFQIIKNIEDNIYFIHTGDYDRNIEKNKDFIFAKEIKDSPLLKKLSDFKENYKYNKYFHAYKAYYIPVVRSLKKFQFTRQSNDFEKQRVEDFQELVSQKRKKLFSLKNLNSDSSKMKNKSGIVSSFTEKYKNNTSYQSLFHKYPLIRKTFDEYEVLIERIITGEDFYEEITKALLGRSDIRSKVQQYQKLLSQYFFNGQSVDIIPSIESKTVEIKVGNDKDYPISDLGDGLQQIIILTYKAFLTDNPCFFCIEEPEMHLHAGYQRQLIKFLLNETPHYYFFTTHSNHFLDMTTEDERIALYRIDKKEVLKEGKTEFQKVVRRCDQDNDILSVLGVRPSSVFLANFTIWDEGITDRLYLSAYMKKYLQEIKESEPEKYAEYSKYIDGYHYAFVEYQGSNLAHWSFDDVANVESTDDNGLKAKAIASNALLIADGDVSNKARMKTIRQQLGMNCFELSCKETENTLPKNILEQVYFNWLPEDGEKKERNYTKMDSNEYHKYSFDMPTNKLSI